MALRSRILASVAFVLCAFLLAGCAGGGSTGEPLSPIGSPGGTTGSGTTTGFGGTTGTGTQTAGGTVSSGDGNAQLVVPNGVGINASAVTIQPTTPSPPDPGIVPGTVYTVSDGTPPVSDAVGQPMALTLKYDPTKLPAGAAASQLGIATLSQTTLFQGWIAVSQGVTVNTTADTVTAPIRSAETYAVFAINPFAAGNVHGQSLPLKCQFSGTASGTINLAVDPSGSLRAVLNGSATPDNGNGSVNLAGAISFTIVLGTTPGQTIFTGTLHNAKGIITGSGTWAGANNSSGVWTIP
jgi:hypothetical protein